MSALKKVCDLKTLDMKKRELAEIEDKAKLIREELFYINNIIHQSKLSVLLLDGQLRMLEDKLDEKGLEMEERTISQ